VSLAADRDWPCRWITLEQARESLGLRWDRCLTVTIERVIGLARGDPELLRRVLADADARHVGR
jgi:hypothetical protein